MDQEQIQAICKRVNTMFTSSERLAQTRQWMEIADYLYPALSQTMNSEVPTFDVAGQKRGSKASCSEPMLMAETCTNLFLGLITNPASIWSQLRQTNSDTIPDPSSELTRWLQEANTELHQALDESNFYTEWVKFLRQYILFGNAALLREEKEDSLNSFTGFNFTCLNIGQVCWQSNTKGMVDTIAWKFNKTASQAYKLWGEKALPMVGGVLESNPDQKFEFVMLISPRDKSKVKSDEATGLASPKERPFQCLYLDTKNCIVLEETGYYDFPAVVGRADVAPGEEYGRGRGHMAIYDVRSYNQVRKDELYGVANDFRPAILANQRDIFGNLPISPGSVTTVRNINGIKELISGARTDRVSTLKEELLNSIKSIFYLDKLMLPPRQEIGQMRAIEVQERIKEIATIFGAVGLRLNSETLTPLTLGSFNMMLRKGAFDPVPAEIMTGVEINISFVNELSTSQQMSIVMNTQQWLSLVMGMAQGRPEVLDIPDFDQITKDMAAALNVNATNINSTDEVNDIREQRAQVQQQQMQLQQANLAADTASKAKNSGMNNEGF